MLSRHFVVKLCTWLIAKCGNPSTMNHWFEIFLSSTVSTFVSINTFFFFVSLGNRRRKKMENISHYDNPLWSQLKYEFFHWIRIRKSDLINFTESCQTKTHSDSCFKMLCDKMLYKRTNTKTKNWKPGYLSLGFPI